MKWPLKFVKFIKFKHRYFYFSDSSFSVSPDPSPPSPPCQLPHTSPRVQLLASLLVILPAHRRIHLHNLTIGLTSYIHTERVIPPILSPRHHMVTGVPLLELVPVDCLAWVGLTQPMPQTLGHRIKVDIRKITTAAGLLGINPTMYIMYLQQVLTEANGKLMPTILRNFIQPLHKCWRRAGSRFLSPFYRHICWCCITMEIKMRSDVYQKYCFECFIMFWL